MPDTEFGLLPTMIGSLPHSDPDKAAALVARFLPDIPVWPQLPRRSFREGMVAQYSEGFPGIVAGEEKVSVDTTKDLDGPLEKLYAAHLDNDATAYGISADYAAGLHRFLGLDNLSPQAIKGQVTGPVTWGLAVSDDSGKAIIYDDMLADAAVKLLRLKAMWQEKTLGKISKRSIIFVDEPAMASYGSSYVPLSRERVVSLIDEVLGGISGLKGVHCCGNTDWSVLLDTRMDIISFDSYDYAQSLTIYQEEGKGFIGRGGAVAWGIVPTDEKRLAQETSASLKDRLEEAMAPFTRHGIPFDRLARQGLLTPSCGLGSLNNDDAAARALELLAELSTKMRKRYL
jgi:methionine synthase II (cobalamin-independent)